MRLVVLDRDGVINYESPDYVKSPQEWIPIPGSLEAVARLNRGGFKVVIATNQAGIGRGLLNTLTLANIHAKMAHQLSASGGHLDGIFICPHHPDDACACRKPKPGLLHQIANQFGISLQGVPMVGDSLRDIEAAEIVGARPMLVRTGYGETTLRTLSAARSVEVFADLAAAVTWLLQEGPQ